MANKRREIERRCEELCVLVDEKSYEEAWRAIEGIEPEELDSVQALRAMAEAGERTGHIDEMKRAYLHLYNITSVRRNLKEFIEVLIRIKEIGDAKLYLKEFEKMDGAIADDFDLRYALAEATGAELEEKIQLLEDFKKEEYMESWGRKLAELYKQAGREDDYKQELSDLHLWFGGVHILPDEPEENPDEEEVGGIIEENLAARMDAHSETLNAISEKVGAEVSRIVEGETETAFEDREPTLDEMLSETGRATIEQLEVEETRPTERLNLEGIGQEMAAAEPMVQEAAYQEPEPMYVEPEPVYQDQEPMYVEPQPVYQDQEPMYVEPQPVVPEPKDQEPEEEINYKEDPMRPSTPVMESVGIPRTASGAPMKEPEHVSLEAQYLNRRGQAETVGEPVKTDDPSKAQRFEQMFTVDENYEEGPADVSGRGIRYWTTRDIIAKIRRREFDPPHFVLAGGEEKITLTMTKKISKELTRLGYNSAQKVMRITAEKMNSIHLMDQIDRLIGRCLLITEAAELTKNSVDELMQVIREFGEEFVVVLSAPFDEIDCFLQIYPELSAELGYKVRMVY